jgi:hypothetical protein
MGKYSLPTLRTFAYSVTFLARFSDLRRSKEVKPRSDEMCVKLWAMSDARERAGFSLCFTVAVLELFNTGRCL